MKKEIISESRLREIISEEAARFKKKLTLEAEKKKLLKRLNEMYMEEEIMEEDMMEEGFLDAVKRFFNRTMGGRAEFEERMATLAKVVQMHYGGSFTDENKAEVTAKAKEDGYGGSLQLDKAGPDAKLVYIDASDVKSSGPSVTSIAREGYGMEEGMMEEGLLDAAKRFFNRTMGGKAEFEERLATLTKVVQMHYKGQFTPENIADVTAKAKADAYGGSLQLDKAAPGAKLVYINAADAKSNSGNVQFNERYK